MVAKKAGKKSARKAAGKFAEKSARKSAAKTGTRKAAAKKGARKPDTRKGARKSTAKRFGAKASKKIGRVMQEFEAGTLKSGKGGAGGTVKSRQQAIAIGISEARAEGDKVPAKRAAKRST